MPGKKAALSEKILLYPHQGKRFSWPLSRATTEPFGIRSRLVESGQNSEVWVNIDSKISLEDVAGKKGPRRTAGQERSRGEDELATRAIGSQ